jgi:hypothetical protein
MQFIVIKRSSLWGSPGRLFCAKSLRKNKRASVCGINENVEGIVVRRFTGLQFTNITQTSTNVSTF